MLAEIEALMKGANQRLSAQRERLAEEFLLSGAMPRDLCMEVGPIQAGELTNNGRGYHVTLRQDFRMI